MSEPTNADLADKIDALVRHEERLRAMELEVVALKALPGAVKELKHDVTTAMTTMKTELMAAIQEAKPVRAPLATNLAVIISAVSLLVAVFTVIYRVH